PTSPSRSKTCSAEGSTPRRVGMIGAPRQRTMPPVRRRLIARSTTLLATVLLLVTGAGARDDFRVGVGAAVAVDAPVVAEPSPTVQDLITANREYREALERVLTFRVRDVERATATVEQRRELYARGIVSRRELEDAERGLDDARSKLEQTQQQIAQADHAFAEALVAALPPTPPSPSSPQSP